VEGLGATDRGGGCVVIGNDGDWGKEMVRSSGSTNVGHSKDVVK